MGFIEQLVGLLQAPQNASHEHVINLLKTFLVDYPQGINECQRPEFDLEKQLTSMITSSMEDDPDLHEVNIAHTAICNYLLTMSEVLMVKITNFEVNAARLSFVIFP